MSLQKGAERRKHHCLARGINGTLTTNDCRSRKMYYCADGEDGYGRWRTAIYNCLLKNESLSNDRSDRQDYWLGYFMYEEFKENKQCVAIQRNDISRSLTNQFRSCSERLPVLCIDEHNSVHTSTPVFVDHGGQFSKGSTESTFNRSLRPISTNTSNVQRPGEKNDTFDLCIKFTAGGAAFSGTIIIFLLVIIYMQRKKLIKASFASLTARRDQNNYDEIPHQMSDSITGQYYEVSPLSEILASGCQPIVQQNIDQIQHVDISGYLIPSSMLETSVDRYQTIAD